jgi:solute carrier family 30 (zinc transporter), member 9
MQRVLEFLKSDPVSFDIIILELLRSSFMKLIGIFLQVVDALYDCKSEVIGPGFFRFKAEIGIFFIFWHFTIYLKQLVT